MHTLFHRKVKAVFVKAPGSEQASGVAGME